MRVNAFAPKVVDEKGAAVGLEMKRRFVIAESGAINQVEGIECDFAADNHERTANLHPALIDGGGPLRPQRVRPLCRLDDFVALRIEKADDVVFDAEAMWDPEL